MSNLVNLVMGSDRFDVDVHLLEAKNSVFEFDYQKMNRFESIRCSENNVQFCLMFEKIVFDPENLLRNISKNVQ